MLHNIYSTVFMVTLLSVNLKAMELQKNTLQAKEFLTKVTDNNRLPTYNKTELVEYLQDRIAMSSAQEKEKEIETSRTLSSGWVWLFTFNYLDKNTAARALYYFPQIVEENFAYRIRKKLGCYISNLTEHEKTYAIPLQKVTETEFSQKLNQLNTNDLDTMKLEESKKLAESILSYLKDNDLKHTL